MHGYPECGASLTGTVPSSHMNGQYTQDPILNDRTSATEEGRSVLSDEVIPALAQPTDKRQPTSLPTSPSEGSATQLGFTRNSAGGMNSIAYTFQGDSVFLPRNSSSDDLNMASEANVLSPDVRSLIDDADHDWGTFVAAYARGQWDAHKAPKRPRATPRLSSAPSVGMLKAEPMTSSNSSFEPRSLPRDEGRCSGQDTERAAATPEEIQDQAGTLIASTANSKLRDLKFEMPLRLSGPLTPRSRNSYPSTNPSLNSNGHPSFSTSLSSADLQTTVATMRWAAARVDISPLTLPSPEHELTDPMRGLITVVPGTHQPDAPVTPGANRRSRLSSFWQGTVDVHDSKNFKIQSLPASKLRSTAKSPQSSDGSDTALSSDGAASTISSITTTTDSSIREGSESDIINKAQLSILSASPPPTTGLHEDAPQQSQGYFTTSHTTPGIVSPIPAITSVPSDSIQLTASDSTPLTSENGPLTVPSEISPQRISLTRQISAPLPEVHSPHDARTTGGRVVSDVNFKSGRGAKEEQLFAELGYLAPPNPPNELERRRALYKFNIWNTGPDMNFDRIAHLAKLVFNTRGVFVSLIDANEQWFKSEWGVKSPSCPRAHSLCAHTILQQGDEPMIILDTHLDWRFAKNPLVTGPSNIRFYAGAPLRTQDGFNIGSLALIDDVPRDDFSPRQRHTLKEFAAIAMREMELWRDKIQLRIRDRIQNSMEEFTRECLEIDSDIQKHCGGKDSSEHVMTTTSMDRIYDRAAKLVQRTLDVEGVIVMDVAYCEVLETMGAEGNVSVALHYGAPGAEMQKRQLSKEDYHSLHQFFAKHPEGKISEGILPHCFRPYMPTHIRYALLVPIFNIDKRPFALLCAYNTNLHSKRLLEGHELSYLRAIGVIILSAVLKRRMILADKAKSLFISNISHELRTPLHGILAAAELLSESPLNHSQMSFVQTVQACGSSLVETVNHVLDFTKLSGNGKAGGVENTIVPTATDLMQLIEEAVDGSWIGYRARTAILGDSGIGSVYSPPSDDAVRGGPFLGTSLQQPMASHVETVIDVGYRKEGWLMKFEKGGIRRVLMNLFGNSLKFTADGYVHVSLRLLPLAPTDPPDKIKVELAIEDTGKGISQNFLKNQLFHPFSQENPLQTGTGLGLAIVNSIVSSETVGGKVDVWSEEGTGTEIRVSFFAEPAATNDPRMAEAAMEVQAFKQESGGAPLPKVALLGFDSPHRGVRLLRKVVCTYVGEWWGLEILSPSALEAAPKSDDVIVILNEDITPLLAATEARDVRRPFVVLSAVRGNATLLSAADEFERIGGFCRILYKPGGPSKLRGIIRLCMHAIKIGGYRQKDREREELVERKGGSGERQTMVTGGSMVKLEDEVDIRESESVDLRALSYGGDGPGNAVFRRNSDESNVRRARGRNAVNRPVIGPRSTTIHPTSALRHQMNIRAMDRDRDVHEEEGSEARRHGQVASPRVHQDGGGGEIVPVGAGSSILKTSIRAAPVDRGEGKIRVLVVEDNNILRSLLTKWLSKKGYAFEQAVDGAAGVKVFEDKGPFDVALIDVNMPVLDGIEATTRMREIESLRARETTSTDRSLTAVPARPIKILALTGMSSLEDKRKAFEAGVDGYLVKPVAFKTLDEMFAKLGLIAAANV